jgi:anti-anti-sigma factor
MATSEPISAGGFSLRTDSDGDALIVRALGELDLVAAPAFDEELRRALASHASAVLVDLSELTFIDSTGLRALVAAAHLSSQNGRKLAVRRDLPPAVERVFDVTRIGDRLLPFVD